MSEQSAAAQVSQDRQGTDLVIQKPTEALPLPASAPDGGTNRELPNAPGGVPSAADIQARLQFVEATHQYIRSYIAAADQKAIFFFTGSTALLAFLFRNGVSTRWLKPVMQWNIIDTFGFIAMVALAIGAMGALLVIIPRTPGSRRGFIFWEAIAEYDTGRHYADELSVLSPASLFQVKAEHCFDLAGVCRKKYRYLRWALWVCSVGLVASLAVFLTSVGPQTEGATNEQIQRPADAPATPSGNSSAGR